MLTSYSTQKNKFQLPCDNHVFRGVSKGSVYFFYERQWARGYILTCCIKLQKYEGLQTLVSEKIL